MPVPARWEDHLATGRPLPAETRAYLTRLAPIVGGSSADDTVILAAVVKSWTEASLFPARPASPPDDTPSAAPPHRQVDQPSDAGLDGPRAAVRWIVRRPVEPGAAAMSAIGGHRAVEGCGGSLCARDGQHRNPTHGRQGKRPAFGAAYVVGWIDEFADITDTPCWRFLHFSQRIQCSKRHRSSELPGVAAMTTRDDDLRVRPGRIQHGNRGGKRPQTFVGEVMRAAKKAGHVGNSFRSSQGRSRSRFGRGRRAAVSIRLRSNARRVVMKARVVRHQGTRFRSAPLPKHIAYLKREGVTRDGEDARMFDAASDEADERAFAERCKDDRHHFRFIVSPEDAAEIGDLKTFTRELVRTSERDLGTARLGRGRSLEHRQPSCPCSDPRPGR